MMKKIIFIIALFVCLGLQAQTLSYQGVARDNLGDIVANQNIGLQFTLRQGSGTGTIVYQETHTTTTNEFGLFGAAIGGGTPVTGTFNTIDWSTMNYWLETSIDFSGGTTYVSLGATEFKAVPFAMYAASSPQPSASNINAVLTTGNNAGGLNMINTGQIGIGTATPATSAALEVNSTTQALLLSRMTSAQRDALTAEPGMVIYNTETNKFQGYAIASAPPAIDVPGTSNSCIVGSYDISSIAYNYEIAQHFVPGSSGTVSTVEFYANGNGIPITAELYSGSSMATASLIATSTNSVTPNFTTAVFNFTGVNLTAGQDYMLRIKSTNALPCATGSGDMVTTFSSTTATGTTGITNNAEFEEMQNCGAPTYSTATFKMAFTLNYTGGAGNWLDLH